MPSGAPGAFVSAPLTLGDAALFTDLYELTMAAAFFREGVGGSATFSLYVRRLPPERGFLVAAGLALSSIFYVLAGVAVLGMILTLLVPTRHTHDLHSTPIEPSVTAVESVSQSGRANPTT